MLQGGLETQLILGQSNLLPLIYLHLTENAGTFLGICSSPFIGYQSV